MQTIIENWVLLYIWVFMITSVLLFMEINAARRVSTVTNNKKSPAWNCSNIIAVLAFSSFPPVGWAVTWCVRRNRVILQKAALENE